MITKDWSYEESKFRQRFLAPTWYVVALTKLHSRKNYTSWKALSAVVKSELKLKEESYDPNKLKLDVSSFGNLGIKKFDHITCKLCVEKVLPIVVQKYRTKLPENVTLKYIMSYWDVANISVDYFDLVGCLIPQESWYCKAI